MDILNTELNGVDYANSFLLEITPHSNKNGYKTWYLTLKETMTRIGIPFYKKKGKNILYQSMYVLKKNGKYYLPLFKEMFILDKKRNELSKVDIVRRNSIAYMLHEWKMLKITDRSLEDILLNTPEVTNIKTRTKIFVLPYYKKNNWKLIQKYPIGIIKNSHYHNY
jgi:hypothetical protein